MRRGQGGARGGELIVINPYRLIIVHVPAMCSMCVCVSVCVCVCVCVFCTIVFAPDDTQTLV